MAVLIGPSGCGKTTTLKMINRLIEPSAGKIYLNEMTFTPAKGTLRFDKDVADYLQSGWLDISDYRKKIEDSLKKSPTSTPEE